MEEKTLRLLKLFFWKCFWIGFALTFAFGLLYYFAGDSLGVFANNMIGMETEEYNELWFEFMTYAKIVLIYLFLVPALALTCICNKCCCKKEE